MYAGFFEEIKKYMMYVIPYNRTFSLENINWSFLLIPLEQDKILMVSS